MNAQNKFGIMMLLLSLTIGQGVAASPTFGDLNLSQPDSSRRCVNGKCSMSDHYSDLSDARSTLLQNINIMSETGEDPRVRASTLPNARMYKPIGFLSVTSSSKKRIPWEDLINGKKKKGFAKKLTSTGFLISPCLVLTNYHAVFGASKTPNSIEFPVTFTANRTVKATPIKWGPKNKTGEYGDDYAILELEKKDCLGLEVGWIERPMLTLPQILNTPMVCAGFPGSKREADGTIDLWVDTNCAVMEAPSNSRGMLLTKGSQSPGNSGGPIAYFDPDGIPHFVAMQTTEVAHFAGVLTKYKREYANGSVSTSSIRDLYDLIEADLQRNQLPANPLASGIATPPNGK